MTRLAPGSRNVSMVFQSYALFPHLTVAENIGFGLVVREVPKARGAGAGRARPPSSRAAQRCSSGGRPSSRAASGSGSRSPARSCASRTSSSSTSRSRTSTRSCAPETRAELKQLHAPRRRDDALRHARPGRGADARAIGRRPRPTATLQQVGTPDEVWRGRRTASWRGSSARPSMNSRVAARSRRARRRRRGTELGIRPEHVAPRRRGRRGRRSTLVEPVGSEALVHLRAGERGARRASCRRGAAGARRDRPHLGVAASTCISSTRSPGKRIGWS